MRLLDHESRLRAWGLFMQLAAIGFIVLEVAFLAIWALQDSTGSVPYAGLAMSMLWTVGFGAWIFWQGGSLRQARWQSARGSSVPALFLALLVPVGTFVGGYMLWLNYSATGRELRSENHSRARAATPEISARNPWPLVLFACAGLAINLVGLIAIQVVIRLSDR